VGRSSWDAAQEARSFNASAVGVPAAAVYTLSWRPGEEASSIDREYVRTPFADASLVKVPGSDFTDEQLASFTALSDVMCTGYHAAVSAGV
jgi:hypothetical protein